MEKAGCVKESSAGQVDEKGGAGCRTALVPVAEAISTSRRRIENLIEHVVSVIDRVELPK